MFVDLRRPEPFPGWSDVAYLLTGALFAKGMFHFGVDQRLVTRIQAINFWLIGSAVAIACFLLLTPLFHVSKVSPTGTLVAYLYPVAWLGVIGFGLICLAIYAPRCRRFIFGLLLLGVALHAAADLLYALDLLGSTYSIGSPFDGLWVLGFLLTAWAAIEHILETKNAEPVVLSDLTVVQQMPKLLYRRWQLPSFSERRPYSDHLLKAQCFFCLFRSQSSSHAFWEFGSIGL